MVVFAARKRAEKWAEAMLNDQMRAGVMVVELRSLDDVKRLWERWGMDFNLMSLNPLPDPTATPYWESIEQLLEIARRKTGVD